ncbi:MAG TPA: hypothetical protein VFU15_07415 [Bacteroidia bacterium]|nr:hypothetical protein [Bacteroidia bacterium]
MEQTNAPSTKGKGLGMAGMIIGIVGLVWAIIPLLGAGAIWLALPGLILSVVAFFMAKNGNNPKKGAIITGLILNLVALIIAAYWIYAIAKTATEIGSKIQNIDTAQLRKDLENSMNGN